MEISILRLIRKSAYLIQKIATKMSNFSGKVVNKSTRIITGVDPTLSNNKTTTLERLYYGKIPLIKPIMPAMPAVGSKPTVTLFIPSLDGSSFFGGAATALVVSAKLAIQSKRQLKIVQTVKTGKPNDLKKFFKSEGIDADNLDIKVISVADRAYNIYGYIPMHKDDIFIASAWWDVHVIDQLPIDKFIYLVQDFEPIFYNNSDEYVMAEQTYKSKKAIPLCNTKLMYDFMKQQNYPAFAGKNVFYFEPAVSRAKSGLVQQKNDGEKKKLFLYGRINVERNLFFTALNAINRAIDKGYLKTNEFELFMAGQDGISDITLSNGAIIKNLGKMNMEDYIKFSKTIDIAISPMMAPHPNYPTLEFASIGSTVVTTKYANKQSLENYSKNIFMSDLDVESMTNTIKQAVKKTDAQKTVDLKSNNINTNWDESLDTVISNVLKSF